MAVSFKSRIPKTFPQSSKITEVVVKKFGTDNQEIIDALSFVSCFKRFEDIRLNDPRNFGQEYCRIPQVIIKHQMMNASSKGNHRRIINGLIETGIIECENNYRVDHYSKGYKFTEKYSNEKWQSEKSFPEFIERFAAKFLAECTEYTKKKNLGLWENFNTKQLQSYKILKGKKAYESLLNVLEKLDKTGVRAELIITEEFLNIAKNCAKEKFAENALERIKYPEKYKDMAPPPTVEEIEAYYYRMAEAINNNTYTTKIHSEFNCKNNMPTNRVFNFACSLHKSFRRFVEVDGERLVNIDIKNSQPTILPIFYKQSNPEEIREEKRYKKLVESGLFYETMAKWAEESPANKKGIEISRKKAKNLSFLLMFGRNEHQTNLFCQVFKKKFKWLAKRIEEVKEGKTQDGIDYDAYKKCAWILQRQEAKIMIEGVCCELLERNIFFIPIHDSILTKKRHVKSVKLCIKKHFYHEMGIKCMLSEEDYTV